jgi:hypothetical protein
VNIKFFEFKGSLPFKEPEKMVIKKTAGRVIKRDLRHISRVCAVETGILYKRFLPSRSVPKGNFMQGGMSLFLRSILQLMS